MKKTYIIGIVLAVLVLVAGAGAFAWINRTVQDVEASHATVYNQYQKLRANAEASSLTVTENGTVVGTYTLAELGVLQDTLSGVDFHFSETDRLRPEEFAALPVKEKLDWVKPAIPSIVVPLNRLDVYEPMDDLITLPRQTSKDAFVEFVDGDFVVHEELSGTQLQVQNVQNAMADAMQDLLVTVDAPAAVRFEVTDCDCYMLPERTVENSLFDFDAMLRDKLRGMTVTVDFHGKTETLDEEDLAQLLYTNEKGKVQVNDSALRELVAGWHQTYMEKDVDYLFNAQIGGVKPIEFLNVDYEINQDALIETLKTGMVELQSMELEAPWYCWRHAQAFAIEGEYVEIDIPNQVMTYVKDGEVLVTTDIVTGATWGYPTPPGLYKVENKDTNCWLSGEDYNVHVDYWIGFVGYQIGIHDADWRTKFGGQNYVRNGSHGCVNTPKDAVKVIFDNIDVGVPVLVYGK